MPLHSPVPVAVLLHLSTTKNWPDFYLALQQVPRPFDLFINLVKGLNSTEVIQLQHERICSDFPDAHIIYSENRGMDIGGMFRLFSQALAGQYQVLLYAHSKSDDAWRCNMLQRLTQHSTQAIDILNHADSPTENRSGMVGAYTYPYDYYNLGPYLSLLAQLGVKVDSTWARYFERYPEMKSVAFEQRIAHARDIATNGLRPELDVEYAGVMLGAPGQARQMMNPDLLRQFIADKVVGELPYYPGNFFWITMHLVRKLSTLIDFEKEHARLPLDLSSDRQFQSRAHAWERVLPVFAVKNGYDLFSLDSG